jgi:hypothetical protein
MTIHSHPQARLTAQPADNPHLVVPQHCLDLLWLGGGELRGLHMRRSSSCSSNALSHTAHTDRQQESELGAWA